MRLSVHAAALAAASMSGGFAADRLDRDFGPSPTPQLELPSERRRRRISTSAMSSSQNWRHRRQLAKAQRASRRRNRRG